MAKITTFAPTPGSRLSRTQAGVIGRELERINEKDGAIKADAVVEAARPEAAPLHPHFTWDDGVAAEKWRIEEARTIIRSVRIIREEIPEKEQGNVRAFVSVKATDDEERFEGNAYIPMRDVVGKPEYRDQLLDAAMSELKNWQTRYDNLKEFFGVYSEIREVEKSIAKPSAAISVPREKEASVANKDRQNMIRSAARRAAMRGNAVH